MDLFISAVIESFKLCADPLLMLLLLGGCLWEQLSVRCQVWARSLELASCFRLRWDEPGLRDRFIHVY